MSQFPNPEAPDSSLPQVPFTVQGGRAVGLTDAQMRSSGFVAPFSGIRMARDQADDLVSRCEAASLLLDDVAALSHVTALRIQGIDLPPMLDADLRLHVITRSQQHRPQRSNIVAHHTTRPLLDTTVVHGLAVTTPAQTWLHVARDLSVTDLVVLGDAMVRRKRPAATVDALSAVVASARKVKGIAHAREALPLIRARTDSSMETRLRLVIVRGGLPCPEVNKPVFDPDGAFVAMPDLCYPELRIAIEYLGDVHRVDGPTWRRDVQRRRALLDRRWAVLEYVSDDVFAGPDRIVAEVRKSRAERLARVR